MTDDPPQVIDGIASDLDVEFAVSLPGLGAEDRRTLAATASLELQSRVGAALDAQLTAAQRADFRRLAGDREGLSRWMDSAVPHYRAATAIERATLIADIVCAVLTSDPDLARGDRPHRALVHAVTLRHIEDHFARHGRRFTRTDDWIAVEVLRTGPRADLPMAVTISRNGRLVLASKTASPTYRIDQRAALVDFVNHWNTRTWEPKAMFSGSEDVGFHLHGEATINVAEHMTRGYLDEVLNRSVEAMVALFDDAPEAD